MEDLFKHVGQVAETDLFGNAVKKIQDGLKGRTNSAVQRYLLLTSHPQGTKSFQWCSKEITTGNNVCDWKGASVDVMLLLTSNPK